MPDHDGAGPGRARPDLTGLCPPRHRSGGEAGHIGPARGPYDEVVAVAYVLGPAVDQPVEGGQVVGVDAPVERAADPLEDQEGVPARSLGQRGRGAPTARRAPARRRSRRRSAGSPQSAPRCGNRSACRPSSAARQRASSSPGAPSAGRKDGIPSTSATASSPPGRSAARMPARAVAGSSRWCRDADAQTRSASATPGSPAPASASSVRTRSPSPLLAGRRDEPLQHRGGSCRRRSHGRSGTAPAGRTCRFRYPSRGRRCAGRRHRPGRRYVR